MVATALLAMAGLGWREILGVVLVTAVQAVAGLLIWRWLAPRSSEIAADIGMSIALGTGLAMLAHVLLRTTAAASVAWALPSLIAALLAIGVRRHRTPSVPMSAPRSPAPRFGGTVGAITIGMVLLLGQWAWALPLLVPAWFTRRGAVLGRRTTKWIAIVAWPITIAVGWWLRSRNLSWWVRSWDVPYYESKSWSVAWFGPGDNMSLAERPMNYHWFGLAWLGSLALIADLPRWTSITIAGPVVIATSCSALLVGIGRRYAAGSHGEGLLPIAFGLGAGAFSLANPPNYASIMWLLAAWLASEVWRRQPSRATFALALFALALVAGAKVSNGLAVAGGLVLADVGDRLRSAQSRIGRTVVTRGLVGRVGLVAMVTGTIYLAVLGGPDRLNTHNLALGWRTLGYLFQVDEGRHPLVFLLGSLGALLELIPLLGAIGLAASSTTGASVRPVIPLLGAAIAYVPLFVLEGEGVWYFGTTTNVLLVAAAAVMVGAAIGDLGSARQWLVGAVVAGWVAGETRDRLMALNWRELVSVTGGPTAFRVASLVGVLALSGALAIAVARLGVSRRLALAVVLLASVTAPTAINRVRALSDSWRASTVVPEPVSDGELVDVAEWLAVNADPRDILAINRFCLEPRGSCVDAKWFPTSAVTRMRVLIEGPFYTIGDEPPAWAAERRLRSSRFVDVPSATDARWLADRGVDWIIVSLQYTDARSWAPWAPTAYSNARYAVLRLAPEVS